MVNKYLECLAVEGNYSKARIGLLLLGIFSLSVFIWLIVLTVQVGNAGKESADGDSVCRTNECQLESKRFHELLNTSVEPCEDFAQFVCGKYLSNDAIPTGSSPTFDPAYSYLHDIGKWLLETMPRHKSSSVTSNNGKVDGYFETDEVLRDQYMNCIESNVRENLGMTPLKETLVKIGGWPITEEREWTAGWKSLTNKSYTWYEHALMIKKQGYPSPSRGLVNYDVERDPSDNSKIMFVLDFPSFLFQTKRFLVKGIDDDYTLQYFEKMIEAAVLLGASPEKAKVELKKSLKFEIEIASLGNQYFNLEQDENIHTGHRSNLRQMLVKMSNSSSYGYSTNFHEDLGIQNDYQFYKYPKDWGDFFRVWLNEYGFKTYGNERVMIPSKEYLLKLSQVFDKYKNEPHVIANYLNWLVVQEGINYLDQSSLALKTKIQNLYCQSQKQKNNYWCKQSTTPTIGEDPYNCLSFLSFGVPNDDTADTTVWSILSGSLYVRKKFDHSLKELVSMITNYTANSILSLINNSHWMNETTKQLAMNKLQNIHKTVAYSDLLLNETFMDSLLDPETSFDELGFYHTSLEGQKASESLRIKQILLDIDPRWEPLSFVFAATVGATYYPFTNQVNIAAGILQDYFFKKSVPNYLNYGSIGSVVGHEMMHAFDSDSIKYDENGTETNWMDDESMKKYNATTNCLVNQYDQYCLGSWNNPGHENSCTYKNPNDGQYHNASMSGNITLSENIADSGIRGSYLAYEKWLIDNGEEQKLPDMEYTNRQMFWMAWARTWCQKLDYRNMDQYLSAVHTRGRYRIIGPLSNDQNFAKDFDCPLGSKMNPKDKCILW